MIICYMSDLHFEFGGVSIIHDIHKNKDNFDVLILAGDISSMLGIENALKELEREIGKKIIFIPGNHEYYNTTKEYMDIVLNESFKDNLNVHILNNSVYEYNDIVFIGSTGWWDGTYNKRKTLSLQSLNGMNDFRLIRDIKKSDNGLEWGKESRLFFERELERFKGRKIVCISHNGPTKKSIHKKYYGASLNECFANNWMDLIKTYQPDYWIHGHTHETIEYNIDKTRVLCNPRGYVTFELNNLFDVKKTFNI